MTFCPVISHFKRKALCKREDEKFSFLIFDKANQILASDWDSVVAEQNIFLKRDYLSVIENLHTGDMQFRYVLVYQKDTPVLVSYFQIIDFKADVFGELINEQLINE